MTTNILGIIPARAGSKRVTGKNLRDLNGRPLITYSFDAAQKAASLSRLIVSTNDPGVIALAEKHGVEVPFLRPDSFASDHATDMDWINHAVVEMEKTGWRADYVVIIRPTSPFRKPRDIDEAVRVIRSNNYDSVRSLTRVKHHPHWMKKIEGGIAKPFIDLGKPDEQLRSQDLPPLFRLNGVADVLKRDNLATGSLYGKTMGYVEIEEERSLDIDSPDDFALGEFLIRQGIVRV